MYGEIYTMQVSLAAPGDSKGILKLYMEFNEDRVSAGVGDANYRYIDGEIPWAKTLTDSECETFVLKDNNTIIGFITIRTPTFNPFKKVKKLTEVDLIVIERPLRRRGLGTMLYKTTQEHLRTKEATHVILNVNMKNTPALQFWQKMGFKELSESEYVRQDGLEEKIIYMIKKL
ncbi:MAG: GNAT family N-acetyltransferase [Candidatus Altiarchaeota archaeon]